MRVEIIDSAYEIAPESLSPKPPASHVIFRTSMPVADFPIGPWPWLCPPPAGPGGDGPCKLAVEGPALRSEEALFGRLGRFLFADADSEGG